ncbi:CASP-like protein 4B3 [Typha latifolia]|uniref:CASP-like protein 4B3 n=1 Tax=Typha latifolia TaxID=4733 RepID=UPI003C2F9685
MAEFGDGRPWPPASQFTGVESNPPSNVVRSAVEEWKMEDSARKSTLVLRSLGWLFSLLSLIIMAANKNGNGQKYDKYCLGIAILSFIYCMVQMIIQFRKLNTGRDLLSRRVLAFVNFVGDQVIAYLLLSAISAAISVTNGLRIWVDNSFTDLSAASISMAFFAFLALALSSLISGYNLSTEIYV